MTLVSMTGFGSARIAEQDLELTVELRSVNSRFLDVSIRAPQVYSSLEQQILKLIKAKVNRGRVEVFITRKTNNDNSFEIRFSEKLYKDFFELISSKAKDFKLKDETLKLELFKLVFSRKEVLEVVNSGSELNEVENTLLEQVMSLALDDLVTMKKVEGAALEKIISEFIQQIELQLQMIKEQAGKFKEQALEKLKLKLEKYKNEVAIDSERVAQELAILFDRADISEEISRLDSHISQFKKIISKNEGGKKLEFLLQEFGREFNTIGSKTQSNDISKSVIEAKSLLEKIREQIANIE